ncbi:hypothetical protein HK105_202855 [Polyrhizophydium stewartii]|uniref:Proteasome inhibitor PI31 subunit n=1 Tax=Polyrhizophydium stewartii TaxID=2732419 RepID=A0ABR4NDG6_9FUNG
MAAHGNVSRSPRPASCGQSVKLAPKLIVHGMGVEDGSVHDMTVQIDSVIAPAAQRWIAAQAAAAQPHSEQELPPLATAFVSSERLEEALYQFKVKIIQGLIPGLNKPGYEESRSQPSQQPSQQPSPPGGQPIREPRFGGGGGVVDPRFGGPRLPAFGGIGNPDLDPLAAAPGIILPRGSLRPDLGDFGAMGGGMMVGPDHPIFGIGGPAGPAGGMPGAGPVRFPPGAVPPGARFDPVGPFGGPARGGRGGFGGMRGPGGVGGPPRFMSGDPDNDDLPPPGYNDMFM